MGICNTSSEYLIGDVARIVGMSRDALRFYEKKGVIRAKKKENGYRYYSEDDIYRLMYILYHRKMNTSLEEIEGLMKEKKTVKSMRNYVKQRMEEEEEALRIHRQAIARLRLVEKDMDRIEKCLKTCSVRTFPLAYIMGNCADLQEGLKLWFNLSSTIAGLDMTYFYNMLAYKDGKLENQGTQLLFYKELEHEMGNEFHPESYAMTVQRECIYMVAESSDTLPSVQMVEQMIQWGRGYGIETDGSVYANDMTSFLGEDKNIYWLELYMPIRRIVTKLTEPDKA